MKYAYLPFNDKQLFDMTHQLVRKFHTGKLRLFQEQFSQTLLVSDGVTQPLKAIPTNRQLYIFTHGNTGLDSVLDSTGGSLTVDELAALLISDGLSMGHQVIKLWACRGGAGGTSSTAAKFKQALRKAGFTKVTVYGYEQDLWSDTKGSSLASKVSGNSDDFADAVRAKEVRVKF